MVAWCHHVLKTRNGVLPSFASQGVFYMGTIYTLLALAPIVVVFVLMVVLGRSAKLSMGAAYVVTALLSLFVWGSSGAIVAAATVNGIDRKSVVEGKRWA